MRAYASPGPSPVAHGWDRRSDSENRNNHAAVSWFGDVHRVENSSGIWTLSCSATSVAALSAAAKSSEATSWSMLLIARK